MKKIIKTSLIVLPEGNSKLSSPFVVWLIQLQYKVKKRFAIRQKSSAVD